MFKHITHNIKGFTLIELLVVMGVISVMASSIVILINPVGQLQRARDAQRKSDLRQIQSALEMYRSDNGNYPASLNNCSGQFGNLVCSIIYLSKVPKDPNSSLDYNYQLGSPAVTYTLKTCLENSSDPQKDTANTCSAPTVSYTLSNP